MKTETKLMDLISEYENALEEKLRCDIESTESETALSDYVQEMSECVMKDPERYGLPIGSNPARYVVFFVVKSQNEYRKLLKKRNDSKIKLLRAINNVKIIEMKIEVEKCLVQRC